MAATLLLVSQDRDLRADLAFVETPTARVDTVEDGRRYFLRDPDAQAHPHLIAYGPDIAARYDTHSPLPAPLGFAWGPAVVLHHQVPERGVLPPFSGLAVRSLQASRVVALPADWVWLLDQLAGHPTRTP